MEDGRLVEKQSVGRTRERHGGIHLIGEVWPTRGWILVAMVACCNLMVWLMVWCGVDVVWGSVVVGGGGVVWWRWRVDVVWCDVRWCGVVWWRVDVA